MKAAALLICICAALPALAEPLRPDTSFFTGVYERAGRDSAATPGLINDLVAIRPGKAGWSLELSPCDAEAGGRDLPLTLAPSGYDEVPNILEGRSEAGGIWCQYFTDHSNYPVLTCVSEKGARFTLWAVTDQRLAACLGDANTQTAAP